jgi:hypothetical protein
MKGFANINNLPHWWTICREIGYNKRLLAITYDYEREGVCAGVQIVEWLRWVKKMWGFMQGGVVAQQWRSNSPLGKTPFFRSCTAVAQGKKGCFRRGR